MIRQGRIASLVAAVMLLACWVPPAGAQDTPTVFIHGLASQAAAWNDTALRLQRDVRITAYTIDLNWRDWYENQAQHLHHAAAGLANPVIAVGHSNGGIVARQWSKSRNLRSVVTMGTPHEGSLLVARTLSVIAFNQQLFDHVNLITAVLSGEPNEFTWMWPFLAGQVGWTAGLAATTIGELATTLGITLAAPVLGQMVPGSAFLSQLNGPPNLIREAAAIQQRVGMVFVARDYWNAGVAVALRPEWQDSVAQNKQIAITLLDAGAAYVRGHYPPWNQTAPRLVQAFESASRALREMDPFWCWAVTNDRSCATSHDGVVATPAQYFPGGTNVGFYGPAHIREIASSPTLLRDVFVQHLRVQLREGGPPPPPPGGGPGPASLRPGERLYPGSEIRSANGAYQLRYQADGNLVVYGPSGPIWNSATHGTSAGHLEMQWDGNLVLYDGASQPVWASGTAGFPNAYLTVENAGHLVINDVGNVTIWWSGGQ
jgi:pimeloyl-ACP methyl ester carboxylesterase